MIYAVIMAGGSGTRFWPESRKRRPKQLLCIAGEKSMIRTTVERILPAIPFERIMVVTGEEHADEIRCQIPELGEGMIIAEPAGRNTAPCIALAAYKLSKIDPEGIMVVLPADHLIKQERAFIENVKTGAEVAADGNYLITFGIVPDRPETGYGYIKLGVPVVKTGSSTVFKVDKFVEKPDRATAEHYVASKSYLWNSGMFVWKVSAIIRAFEAHLPRLSESMENILQALNTSREAEAIDEAYATMEAISIDYAVMEKADNALTLPIDVGWNDVGSWASLSDVWGCDHHGNATRGLVVIVDGKDCIVRSSEKITAIIGVEDLIVVDTPDALLVCHRERTQDVRKLQEVLKNLGYENLL